MRKSLHPRDNIDYFSLGKRGGKGLGSIEDSIDTLIQWIRRLHKKKAKKCYLQRPETTQRSTEQK